MIVPMKKAANRQPFFISITDRGVFPVPQYLPKGRTSLSLDGGRKNRPPFFLVENIQHIPLAFVRSVYD